MMGMGMERGGKGRGWHKRLMKKIIEEGIVKKMKMMMMSEQKDPGSNTLPPA